MRAGPRDGRYSHTFNPDKTCLLRCLWSLHAEYAQVTRMLGNGRLEAFCFDGVNRLCHIRGKLRKRVWIGVGDIVLLGLREFQDQKADIILKYDGDEARSLKTYGELPDTVQINAGAETLEGEEFGDDNFDFDEDAEGAEMDEIVRTAVPPDEEPQLNCALLHLSPHLW